jgi:predicted dehydrogenase
MTSTTIGVGIVGANPDRGWALRAHVPALASLPQFRLTAVSTTRRATADAAREAFGAERAYTDAHALAADPAVDLVVVTVRVSAHADLVGAALAAGKHVYCEWPLASDAAQARALAAAATDARVLGVTGLQARFAPAVRRARDLVGGGGLGRVLSATLTSSRAKGNSRAVPGWTAYTYDLSMRAGLVEVLGGHALDLVEHLLGPLEVLAGHTTVRSDDHVVAETGERLVVTSPDHLSVLGRTTDGAPVTVQLHDAEAARPRTRLEIAGTEGDLLLLSSASPDPWAAQLQIGDLEAFTLRPGDTDWQPLGGPGPVTGLPEQARNVARLYAALGRDLVDGTRLAPTFAEAADLHALLERVSPGSAA